MVESAPEATRRIAARFNPRRVLHNASRKGQSGPHLVAGSFLLLVHLAARYSHLRQLPADGHGRDPPTSRRRQGDRSSRELPPPPPPSEFEGTVAREGGHGAPQARQRVVVAGGGEPAGGRQSDADARRQHHL